jgi:hypothetical protein
MQRTLFSLSDKNIEDLIQLIWQIEMKRTLLSNPFEPFEILMQKKEHHNVENI